MIKYLFSSFLKKKKLIKPKKFPFYWKFLFTDLNFLYLFKRCSFLDSILFGKINFNFYYNSRSWKPFKWTIIENEYVYLIYKYTKDVKRLNKTAFRYEFFFVLIITTKSNTNKIQTCENRIITSAKKNYLKSFLQNYTYVWKIRHGEQVCLRSFKAEVLGVTNFIIVHLLFCHYFPSWFTPVLNIFPNILHFTCFIPLCMVLSNLAIFVLWNTVKYDFSVTYSIQQFPFIQTELP